MISSNRKILLAVVAGLTLMTGPVFAQADKQPPTEQERSRQEATTLTGCLTKGDGAGMYNLTEASGDKKMAVPSSGVDLEKHAMNHTVKLTGSLSSDGKTLTVSKIEHVSETCQTK